jgi:formamidopyrimidine-DNA glycosylase
MAKAKKLESGKTAPMSDKGLPIDIGISEKDRAAVATELSKMLADSYTLYLMTHNFHWNVTGPLAGTGQHCRTHPRAGPLCPRHVWRVRQTVVDFRAHQCAGCRKHDPAAAEGK